MWPLDRNTMILTTCRKVVDIMSERLSRTQFEHLASELRPWFPRDFIDTLSKKSCKVQPWIFSIHFSSFCTSLEQPPCSVDGLPPSGTQQRGIGSILEPGCDC